MSSTYIVEPTETSGQKKDDTLIIVVSDDGTISVDQETLQNLIMNQSSANVSVVRVGQTDANVENGDITLTVDPPTFVPTAVTPTTTTTTGITMNPANIGTDPNTLVDPFMEMDPEQLERLETALQSEEAKQILGENVTAMLDMLTVEERQKSIRYSVELDHCYTSRLSPSEPKPKDPLPITNSPTSNETDYIHQASPSQGLALPPLVEISPGLNSKGKTTGKAASAKQVVRPRKPVALTPSGINSNSRAVATPMSSVKQTGQTINKPTTGPLQPVAKAHGRVDEEDEDDVTSSGDSSGSEPPSDDDSDFGPRMPKGNLRAVNSIGTGGIRSRGGRKGLTTRGGSMAASRRGSRGANKQMDLEQVRRLDLEMAAAVNAMKSPGKDDRCGANYSPMRGKRQIRITPGRKRDDSLPMTPVTATSEKDETHQQDFEKSPQTTNHVKASLISANMIKGDMILTKPGQARSNQRVTFVQKQVAMKQSDLKNIGGKKELTLTKRKFVTQCGTKFFATKDGKLVEVPASAKSLPLGVVPDQTKESTIVSQPSESQHMPQVQVQEETGGIQVPVSPRVSPAAGISPKAKSLEIKKEKRRSESNSDSSIKAETDTINKPIECATKTLDSAKKHQRKEHRKSPGCVADALGPALFSTPDIIRRVGSGCDTKLLENTTPNCALSTTTATTVTTPIAIATTSLSSGVQSSLLAIPNTGASQSDLSNSSLIQENETNLLDCLPRRESITNMSTEERSDQTESTMVPIDTISPMDGSSSLAVGLLPGVESEAKSMGLSQATAPEDLQPSLDPGGIEGEEHLLATLEMEASKHEEELLAEALLLQEELGVDLADHPALGENSSSVNAELVAHTGSLLTNSITPDEHVDVLPSTEADISNVMDCTSGTSSPGINISCMRETPTKRSVKEDKEPIRIVRGGRVITLPPIEAPATRSKKLQAKTDLSPLTVEMPKKLIDKQSSAQTIQAKARMTKEPGQRVTMQYGLMQREEEEKPHQQDEQQQEFRENLERVHSLQVLSGTSEPICEGEGEDDEDEEEEDEGENSDSEDDPDRLWCICKRPHNNRFMICCDVCEDWFHGKCVHVSKAMGQQMEEKGIEWVCPNCVKKKSEEAKSRILPATPTVGKQQRMQRELEVRTDASSISLEKSGTLPRASASSLTDTSPPMGGEFPAMPCSAGGTMQCVVCKKEARNSSIYCSDACILAHAQETLTKDKPAVVAAPAAVATATTASAGNMGPKLVKSSTNEPVRVKLVDSRVVVFERKTGRLLSGLDAPTRSNLKNWLKENPTFEVISANNLTTTVQGKSIASPTIKIHTTPKTVFGKVISGKQASIAGPSKKMPLIVSSGSPQIISGLTSAMSPKTISIKSIGSVNISGRSPLTTKHGVTKVSLITAQGSKVAGQLAAVGSTTSGTGNVSGTLLSPKLLVNKKQDLKQQSIPQTIVKQPIKASPPKRPEAEPIRVNIRKSLTDLLTTRIRATDDLKLTVEEIAELAVNIEHELYKHFKDTGAKYKAKYRSLVFNIKDTKNLTLFRKIADRSLTPDAVVRLSPEEMASQELAEWREKETKHQLEMIKKNELDLMAQAKSIVVKTHKGEQIIENDGAIDHVDPKTPVQDIVTALNSGDSISSTVDDTIDKEKDKERELRDRDRERDREKSKITEGEKGVGKQQRKEKDRGRGERENRSKGNSRRERSTSRSRHRRGSRERERSKSRERSKERKSSRNKESKREKEREREKEKNRDRTERKDREKSKTRERGRDRSRQKEKERERDKDKEKEKLRDKEKYKSSSDDSQSRNHGTIVEAKDHDERRRENERMDSDIGGSEARTDGSKPIEDRLWRHIEDETTSNTIDGNDSDVSDREPTSTVTIKTPDINDDSERLEREQESTEKSSMVGAPSMTMGQTVPISSGVSGGSGSGPNSHTVWRGFVSMVDVAKFFITAQEISGNAKDLMEDLPDTVDVVGRISHETVWDYISKMKRTGSKEILVIRLTAANDEEKIPYITLYSYLNSRSRLGVVGNVSKNIKDFYIMPFSKQSSIPQVLLPLMGPGLEEQRPHLLLGIIVRNRRKRLSAVPATIPLKVARKDADRSYTPPLLAISNKEKSSTLNSSLQQSPATEQSRPVNVYQKAVAAAIDSVKEKQSVTQTTLESLNKAHVGMSRSLIDSATISKIVPELSSKIDLTSSPCRTQLDDDGDEPYSPGQIDDEKAVSLCDIDMRTMPANLTTAHHHLSTSIALHQSISSGGSGVAATVAALSSNKNSNDLQRKMDELNRQIEEQKQQIQSISSSFLGESSSTLPGLGLDPIESRDSDEAYSPSDTRSFTPPPPSSTIPKLAQPLLEKVSNITIPPNLQEILANVKRQESTKVDPYLPLRPSATFLPTVNSSSYQNLDKYSNISSPSTINPVTSSTSISSMSSCSTSSSPTSTPSLSLSKTTVCNTSKSLTEGSLTDKSQSRSDSSTTKESKSTLSSLSDLDLIRKAEEELAAVAAAAAVISPPTLSTSACTDAPSPTQPRQPASLSTRNSGGIQQSPTALTGRHSPTIAAGLDRTALLSNLEHTTSHLDTATPGASSSNRPGYHDTFKKTFAPEQPKPPGLEDEDFPPFPSTPPNVESSTSKSISRQKLLPKSGIVLSVKRKVPDDGSKVSGVPNKTPRTKTRWGQPPSDALE